MRQILQVQVPQMNPRAQLVADLVKLISLDFGSSAQTQPIRLSTEHILGLAFRTPKPLFASKGDCGISKSAAGELLVRALPLLDRGIHHFSTALELDLKEHAKAYRSGLQYLVDEFVDQSQVYSTLTPIFSAASVLRLEEYLRNNRDTEPEFTTCTDYLSASDRKQIIPSHTWWF